LPQLRDRADTVTNDLNKLLAVRTRAEAEAELLRTNASLLFEEQLRIATLLEARRQGVARASSELESEEREAEALAAEATSLNQLIETLAARISSVAAAVDAAADSDATNSDQDAAAINLALANTSRTE